MWTGLFSTVIYEIKVKKKKNELNIEAKILSKLAVWVKKIQYKFDIYTILNPIEILN